MREHCKWPVKQGCSILCLQLQLGCKGDHIIVREECSCCSRLAPTLATHLSIGTLHAVESQERLRLQWCAGSLGVGLAPGNTQMCKSSLKVVYNNYVNQCCLQWGYTQAHRYARYMEIFTHHTHWIAGIYLCIVILNQYDLYPVHSLKVYVLQEGMWSQ